jgi:hypothetical protein
MVSAAKQQLNLSQSEREMSSLWKAVGLIMMKSESPVEPI